MNSKYPHAVWTPLIPYDWTNIVKWLHSYLDQKRGKGNPLFVSKSTDMKTNICSGFTSQPQFHICCMSVVQIVHTHDLLSLQRSHAYPCKQSACVPLKFLSSKSPVMTHYPATAIRTGWLRLMSSSLAFSTANQRGTWCMAGRSLCPIPPTLARIYCEWRRGESVDKGVFFFVCSLNL